MCIEDMSEVTSSLLLDGFRCGGPAVFRPYKAKLADVLCLSNDMWPHEIKIFEDPELAQYTFGGALTGLHGSQLPEDRSPSRKPPLQFFGCMVHGRGDLHPAIRPLDYSFVLG